MCYLFMDTKTGTVKHEPPGAGAGAAPSNQNVDIHDPACEGAQASNWKTGVVGGGDGEKDMAVAKHWTMGAEIAGSC